MRERQIEQSHIEQVLASPTETIKVRFSRRGSFGNVNGRRLLVIYEVNADEVEVVTAFWINKDGLKKYGFTRV